MYQTIIIGIDGRSQDAEVLALAQQLAEPGAELIAVSVAVTERSRLHAPGRASDEARLDAAEEVVDAFTEPRVRLEGVVASAPSVGEGLRDIAVGARADLIVVASSRRGLAGRIFAGDAVRDVLRHAPCPVAVSTVGHASVGPLERITVGYDGSQESDAALGEAVRLGQRDGASVSLVEIVEPAVAASAMEGAYPAGSFDDEYQRARDNLDRVAERYGLHGVIQTGRPAHELAEASRDADLLVIGLREYSLLDRLLVGSTAHALLREQSAPMLITPPDWGPETTHDALDSPESTPAGEEETA